MTELTYQDAKRVQEFYKKATDTSIFSALQGYMGRIFADSKTDIKHTMILQGDFLFPSNKECEFEPAIAKQMLNELTMLHPKEEILIISQSSDWTDYLNSDSRLGITKRYALSKTKISEFDIQKLSYLANQLPDGYRYARIDEKIANQALSMEWSKYFCFNFDSAKDYVKRGIGIAVLEGENLVCAASSYTVYTQGVEIEIATKEDHRKQGLATMCGARFLLECIKEKLAPNWDAANKTSLKIATRLGYQFLGDYDAYYFK